MKTNLNVAYWTHEDAEAAGHLYYFAPLGRTKGPYFVQRHVDAIIDIANDGTLAGVELIDRMPSPPTKTIRASDAHYLWLFLIGVIVGVAMIFGSLVAVSWIHGIKWQPVIMERGAK